MSLNFREKRALQTTVDENLAALEGVAIGFREKRKAQQEIDDALTKLGADGSALVVDPVPQHGRLDVSGIKARFTAEMVMDVPADWVVMNAPRPLLGTKTLEGGPFLSGRFYAAIDPKDTAAANFLEQNIKLDARVVLQGIDEALQAEMGLVDNKYAEQYREEYKGDELFDVLSPQINKLQDKTVAELESIIARARGGGSPAPDPASTEAGDQSTVVGAESPFQPLIEGKANNLSIPDFIKRLEAAYEEEEALDKAKQAAIQYLEANRASLEVV